MIKKLVIWAFSACLAFPAVSFANPDKSVTLQMIIAPYERQIDEMAGYLSDASYYMSEWGSCARRCKKNIKYFAGDFIRLLNEYEVESPEVAQAIIIQSLLKAHQYNQGKNKTEMQNQLFQNKEKFEAFQAEVINQINNRSKSYLQKGALIVGAIVVVVLSGGVGFYIGGMLFYGLTWEILVSGLVVATVAGTTSYKLVASPILSNYNETHMAEAHLQFLLNEIQKSPSDPSVVLPLQ